MNNQSKAQLSAMIKDTILKELRSKTLIFIFVATTLMIFLGHALLKLMINSNGATASIMVSGTNSLTFMFTFINFWSVIIASIFGISSIQSDFKDKIIYQYLSFPISRTQYMFTRICGSWLLVYGYYLYAYLLSAILFSFATHSFALSFSHLLSILLMGLYVFLIIIISFLYSLIAEKIAAFLLVFTTVIIISLSNNSFKNLTVDEYFKDLGVFKIFGLLIYALLPRLNYISQLASAVMLKEPIDLNLGLEALHLLVSSALLLIIGNTLIKSKNF